MNSEIITTLVSLPRYDQWFSVNLVVCTYTIRAEYGPEVYYTNLGSGRENFGYRISTCVIRSFDLPIIAVLVFIAVQWTDSRSQNLSLLVHPTAGL